MEYECRLSSTATIAVSVTQVYCKVEELEGGECEVKEAEGMGSGK